MANRQQLMPNPDGSIMSFPKWGEQYICNTNQHTLSHLKPVDECRKAAVCLKRLHVQVSDEVNHSHGSCHKLQPTVVIHTHDVQQVHCQKPYIHKPVCDLFSNRLRNIISIIKSNIFQDNKNVYRQDLFQLIRSLYYHHTCFHSKWCSHQYKLNSYT